MATIKVKIKDLETGEIFNMLFGDSYKSWKEQYAEYLRMYKNKVEPLQIWKSNSKWKGFGGLKWCSEDSFQEELNREDVQKDEPDNPNPRQYKDFEFIEIQLPTNLN